MATTILLRRGDATSKNPVLQLGEPGWDTVNRVMKVGDGHTPWRDLPDASSYVLPEYLAEDKVPTLGEDGKVLPAQLPDPIPQGEPQTSESLADLLQAEGPAKTHLDATFAVGHTGPDDPEPGLTSGAEYVWFKTDGAGTLLDILTGVKA